MVERLRKNNFISESKMVKLNQNKKPEKPVDQMLRENLIFYQKYSSTFKQEY